MTVAVFDGHNDVLTRVHDRGAKAVRGTRNWARVLTETRRRLS